MPNKNTKNKRARKSGQASKISRKGSRTKTKQKTNKRAAKRSTAMSVSTVLGVKLTINVNGAMGKEAKTIELMGHKRSYSKRSSLGDHSIRDQELAAAMVSKGTKFDQLVQSALLELVRRRDQEGVDRILRSILGPEYSLENLEISW